MGEFVVVQFSDADDWAALNAARAWCKARGVSYGPTDRTRTIGLLVGDYLIAKWHNLTPKERRECHGTITGDARNGPLTLRISSAALATHPTQQETQG